MEKTLIILAITSTLLSGCLHNDESEFKSEVPVTPVIKRNIEDSKTEDNEPGKETTIPTELNLDVQFYSQAPKADWGMPYQEACEEASLILAHNYVTHQTMTLDEFDQAIRDMVDWQVETYGTHKDITMDEVGTIAEKYLGYTNFEIVENPTPTQIKEYLSKGYPIVAPFAGRQLGNPFFTGEGPIYHMLLIRGYENGKFITNDVGTRRGENFVYEEGIFMSALHDWVEGSLKDPVLMNRGPKKIMILK